MSRRKSNKKVSRKELEEQLRSAEQKVEQEKEELYRTESFSAAYSLQKDKYNAAVSEVNRIKREIFSWRTRIVKIGVLLVAVMVALGLFLKKVHPSITEDGALHLKWWPGVDFCICVYKDHVMACHFNDMDMKVLEIPDTILGKPVTEIREYFAYNVIPLEKIILGDNVERIGESAFNSMSTIKEVIGGKNVKYVDSFAFLWCSSLEYVEFGDNLEMIGDSAFLHTSIKCISTSDKLRYIGNYALGPSKLEEIYIPSSLSDIGVEAFWGTPWWENQKADEEGFIIIGDGVLAGYEGNESIIRVPDGVKTLMDFWDGTSCDTVVYIPDTVTSIEEYIFGAVEHQLTLYIPASVTRITNFPEGWQPKLTSRFEDYEHNLHIITTENSTAHQYAVDRGISFKIVEELPEY